MNRSINTVVGTDGHHRCWWCGHDPLYVNYHDNEWGVPTADDQKLFEKISLEGFQAGLSWITILRKREAFRSAFLDFDYRRVAKFSKRTIDRLVVDRSIIRHRGKIESVVNNARRMKELLEQSRSLSSLLWQFEPARSEPLRSRDEVPGMTDESDAMSRELKRLGWTFVGPTTCYALMQAVGMVNDHLQNCGMWQQVEQARKQFSRPR